MSIKEELKNLHQFKSYDNKINSEIIFILSNSTPNLQIQLHYQKEV